MSEVILSTHSIYQLMEREIDVHEAKRIAKNGKISKIDLDGTITRIGICSNGKILSVVIITYGNRIKIKTAYYNDN